MVHIIQDGGTTWSNVISKDLKESIINVVEPSPYNPASAYIAVTKYKLNDFTPYIFKTDDLDKNCKWNTKEISKYNQLLTDAGLPKL